MPYKPALAIVIPVYNEANNLPALLRDWQQALETSRAAYRMILVDDGSKDDSLQLLRTMAAADPTLDIHTQPNAGHGPAILRGYRLALDCEWIFQIDSDHQLDTAAFLELWRCRTEYDFLLGQRLDKNASAARRWVSRFSTWSVRLFYGAAVRDVNSPYRLMRAECLRVALEKIPANAFAPNVLITAWFVRKGKRIFTIPVQLRKEGCRPSRMSRYFLRGTLQSFVQTILFRIKR